MNNENEARIPYGAKGREPQHIHTAEQLLSFIDEIGFLPLFKNTVPGFSVEEHTSPEAWWSGDVLRDPWEWRGLLAASGKVAYGKFFDRKAGFLSLEWLPYFANLRRDGYDFDARWEDARAGFRHKKIMDLFPDHQARFSFEIKSMAGFGKNGEKNFEGVLTDLQMQTYLCVSEFLPRLNRQGIPYGWAVAVYTTPEALWGADLVSSAYGESPRVSGERICARLRACSPAASDEQIRKILRY